MIQSNNTCLISPIFYMGNKKKLINKGLISLFPENINTFYDLFGGSGVVSMNTNANKYVLNDLDKNVLSFYKMFKTTNSAVIIANIMQNIVEFDMLRTGVKQRTPEAVLYKAHYTQLRNKANLTKDVVDIYSCMFYAFSQQMRFNKKGEFNMPFGNGAFTVKNEEYIKTGCDFFQKENVSIFNKNYLDFTSFNEGAFVYLDPPYLNTTATYNEGIGWNLEKEKQLYSFIEDLLRRNINFGMSNIMSDFLYAFCVDNNLNVYHFSDFNYRACGKSNKVDEVYISNYKVNDTIHS